MRKYMLAAVLCSFVTVVCGATDFVWKTGDKMIVACEDEEEPVVHVALDLLDRDCRSVLSQSFTLDGKEGDIYVGTLGESRLIAKVAKTYDVDLSVLSNHSEAFMVKVLDDGKLLVAGSDKRGTAYGIIELTRMLGVSPWEWWADAVPAKKTEFRINSGFVKVDYPRVPYRGIFINDEDWGLMPWSSTNYEPLGVKGSIGPKTHARIFELLLRLRANTFWPAMHECSVPFFFTEGNKEMADRYAIYLGTSHCEPMMRNTNGEWRRVGKGSYNYVTNRDNVLSFWEERVKLLRHSDDIYTLGMRGIHDSGMLGADTPEERKTVLTQVIKDQRELLARYKRDVETVPQVLIPYKEVLDVYNAGLEIPEDVTLMWCDDNYGYVTHFPTVEEASRKGGNGIYYHVSYWGPPHDYLWLSTVSPYLVYQQMKAAYDKGIRKMWILNVGDIKPAEYQIELFMDMAWDIRQVEQSGVTAHLFDFLAREFGAVPASGILPVMREHYRQAFIRRPEFMGGTRTEEYDPKYEVVTDLPWSEKFIRARLAEYQRLEDQVVAWGRVLPEDKRPTYYQLVQYPVQGAAEMNKKFLYAQLARHGKADWEQSTAAYDSIVALTARYNTPKWKGIMDYKPRNQAVFFPVPQTVAEGPMLEDRPFLYKWNALQATGGTPVVYEGLGFECMAAGIEAGKSLTFDFGACNVDSVEVELRMLPSHPVNGSGLRIQVALDGQVSDAVSYHAKPRSEEWKQNILSGQAVRRFAFPVDASSGAHCLTVTALDEGVILDQIYIYKK